MKGDRCGNCVWYQPSVKKRGMCRAPFEMPVIPNRPAVIKIDRRKKPDAGHRCAAHARTIPV